MSEERLVEASASSFYRVMKQEQLMEKRQWKPKTPQKKPEVNPNDPLMRFGAGFWIP